MRSQHLPMTIEEFKVMPRKPGWKYEYWNKQAHISPAFQYTKAMVEVKPLPVTSPCKIRHINTCDEPRLISLYISAFSDTIEYCDWKSKDISGSAGSNIKDFFAGKRGRPLPVSRAALCAGSNGEEEDIVGAALITGKQDGQAVLDLLFVGPGWQRKGVASALVSAVISELSGSGCKGLMSCYHLGNEASSNWHRSFEFVEIDK